MIVCLVNFNGIGGASMLIFNCFVVFGNVAVVDGQLQCCRAFFGGIS